VAKRIAADKVLRQLGLFCRIKAVILWQSGLDRGHGQKIGDGEKGDRGIRQSGWMGSGEEGTR